MTPPIHQSNSAFAASNPIIGALNAGRLSKIARDMYTAGPVLLRKLQHWRPYICPFERLVGLVQDGERVLDIGCGAGLLLSLMAGIGTDFEGTGFDVSQRAINLAKHMANGAFAKTLQARLVFERLDAQSPWPVGTFDVVFLLDVLHHVPASNQKAFFDKAISKVKAGGVFVFKDMCRSPSWRANANRLHDFILAGETIHYVPIKVVEAWATDNGMEIQAREDLNRFWYGHELRVMRRSPVLERAGLNV